MRIKALYTDDVLRGARWVIADLVLKNILLFGILIVLTRLVSPADFGIVAMLGLFVGLSAALTEAGLGAALIQAKDLTELDKSTVFWTQLALGLVLGGALASGGPVVAALFDQPVIAMLAIGYGINTLVSSLIPVQWALFAKDLDFKPVTHAQLTAELVSGGAAISAALFGAGVWALFIHALARTVIITTTLWLWSPWRPSLMYSFRSLKKFLGFGLYTIGNGLLLEVESRIGSFFLGQVATPAATGYFQRASSIRQQLAKTLSGAITRVAFPTFSALQEERDRFLSALRQAMFINLWLTTMLMWTTAATAEPAVRIAFGEDWMPMVPALQALCVASGFHSYFAVFAKALRATGRARLVFLQYIIRAGGAVIVTAMLVSHGMEVLAWALTGLFLLLTPVHGMTAARHLGYAINWQVSDLLPIVSAGVVLFAVTIGLDSVLAPSSEILRLVLLMLAALCSFLGTMALWFLFTPMIIGRRLIANVRAFAGGKKNV